MSKSIHKTQRVSRTHFPFEIAIPSYKRQETLQEKTLAVLKEYRIPVNKITVFVANKERKDLQGISRSENLRKNCGCRKRSHKCQKLYIRLLSGGDSSCMYG